MAPLFRSCSKGPRIPCSNCQGAGPALASSSRKGLLLMTRVLGSGMCMFLGGGSLGAGNRTRIKGIVGADQRFPFIFLHPSPINTGERLVHQSRQGSVSFVCGWISNA